MTKAELVKLYAEATQLPVGDAGECLERLGDIVAAELLGGGSVPLPGVGKLVIKARAARTGRNPRTGEPVDIPARQALGVSLSKDF
ncbi:HU family DNA-binding protein [Desulfovibrio legallii]|jgi:DNA-binding protein HU-beta|uniref:HU family DNA-binding protein n=1 Tax=Desulfovibrio legallii TaxID=571438 RepID=A0A6H3FDQ8_9BACT|nr:HU family DNA-binding protein [Desulfovibrio legallii]TBH79541.1 HU family DNA-binding protein [Desulfovibrio legallii]DAZ80372.1 MAG TPA: DNA binding protein [Caudoviricetes sp.]